MQRPKTINNDDLINPNLIITAIILLVLAWVVMA